VERLNGAVLAVRERLDSPRFVEGHRLAAFDPRGTEVDVVLDLMIHDLDLILHLFGVEPTRVEAVGVAVFTDRVDIANARLEFPGGELVNLTASRASREPVRKLRLFQEDAYLSLDLNGQRAEIFARDAANAIGIAHETRLAPEGHNPLVAEIDGFASAIRGQASPVATAEEGRRAVALATRIRQSIDARRNVWAAGVGGVGWHDAPS
jgi:predicted dehydrogenase